jgi:MmyB-like transcription regulator ligand binding domain/Helix-turn-helix domain
MPTTLTIATPDTRRRAELRDFLIGRRAQVSPADAGMPAGGRRRTPGLRREEVAVLAGVGVSWYQWLEQGRDITVSSQVLDSVGRVLRLSEPERQHLYALAGLTPPPLRTSPETRGCDLALRRMIDAWLPNPGHIVDRYWNITAMNSAARLIFGFDKVGTNCLIDFFETGQYDRGYQDPDGLVRRVVGQFRAEMTNHPGDPVFAEIVDRLLRTSPRFAEAWNLHEVHAPGTNLKVYVHPQVGELQFESTQLRVPEWPDLTVVMHTPLAETDTRVRLEKLISEYERRHGLRVAA